MAQEKLEKYLKPVVYKFFKIIKFMKDNGLISLYNKSGSVAKLNL